MMNQLSGALQDKKALVILGLAIVFIIFMVYMIFMPSRSVQSIETTTTPTPVQRGRSNLPGNAGQGNSQLLTYQNLYYRVDYPIDFYATATVVDGLEGGVLFEQDIENSPRIEIQIYNDARKVDRISEIMKSMGYSEKSSRTKNGYPVKEYSGKSAVPDLQDKVAVIAQNGKVYKFQLTYKSNSVNTKYIKVFDEILNSFKLL